MPDFKKGVAYNFDTALVNSSSRPDLKAAPTLATGDVKISKDEGAFANLTTLPTVSPAGGTNVKVPLSATEATADRVVITFIDQTTPKEWDDVHIYLSSTEVTVDDLVRSTTPANTLTVDASNRIGGISGAINTLDDLDTAQDTQHAATQTLITSVSTQISGLTVQKNTAFPNFEFPMVLTSDHTSPAVGLVVTGERSIDGAAFAAVSGSIVEISDGIYAFDALAADANGDVITWRFSSATADDTFVTFKTVT